MAEPLLRIIMPMRWDKALEKYFHAYEDLTALCGFPTKE